MVTEWFRILTARGGLVLSRARCLVDINGWPAGSAVAAQGGAGSAAWWGAGVRVPAAALHIPL